MRTFLLSLFICSFALVGCGGRGEETGQAVAAKDRLKAITNATNQLDSASRKTKTIKELNEQMVANPDLRTPENNQKLVAGLIQVDAAFRAALDSADLQPQQILGGSAFDFAEIMAQIMQLISQERDTFTELERAISEGLMEQDQGALDRPSQYADELAAQARDRLAQAERSFTPMMSQALKAAYEALATPTE